ncbi:hypothetical protein CVT25_010334 [Psilocybe cyanescens]|uniref:Uncharacterized protein n=1 Tax=Psilocybe cyanescens TaxID=93625 RepID=A0A409XP40_PSICY|nr:hypothetical protein CVT25_010334 [Psilocybe cyanescens]
MFSFLSQLRLPSVGIGTQPQEEEDDTSSSGRSLSLPWPVTESSTKKTPASTAAKREWMANHPIAQSTTAANGINISYPIPRTANSLTAFDSEFPAPPSGLAYGEPVHVYGNSRPLRAGSQYSGTGQGAWYEQDKSNPQASVPFEPPQVVRLNSTVQNPPNDESKKDDNGGANVRGIYLDTQPPPSRPVYKYTSHPSPSAYAQPYLTPGGSGGIAPTKTNQVPSNVDRSDYDNESEHEFYTSPFDLDPLEASPRTITGNASMTKSRWNLKLQLHSSGAQSTPSLVGAGTPQANRLYSLPHFASQNPLQMEAFHSQNVAHNNGDGHMQNQDVSHYALPASVDTDVYNHAYNYPLAKQLSPIAEQDYFSPITGDAESRSISLKFGKGGDGNVSKASLGAESTISSVLAGAGRKEQGGSEMAEWEAIRARSGSVGSMGKGLNLSRAGSTSRSVAAQTPGSQNASPIGSIGSEIARPSPVHPSPFLTRHLNRTVSQTSSKSDSQPQCQAPQTQTQAQTPATTHIQGQTPAPTRAVAQLSTGSTPRSATAPNGIANTNSYPYGREVVQTPISAGTTSSTTGPFYTPTSTLLTPTAQMPTPTSPLTAGIGGSPAISPPPVAVTTNSLHGYPTHEGVSGSPYSTTRLPKIPSLASIPPLDLRFSLLGSVGPRVSREVRMERAAKSGSNAPHRRSLGDVERMPVIDGSVDGHYDEEEDEEDLEEEEEYDDEEGDEEEEDTEEYDRESLHAESFVTAGTNEDADIGGKGPIDPDLGVELATLGKHSQAGLRSGTGSLHSRIPSASASNSVSSRSLPATTLDPGIGGIASAPRSATGDSFIHRRWDRDAALGFGTMSSSPTTFRAKGHSSRWPTRMFSTSFFSSSSSATFTPAFWAFWLGFICPVLWLVGGWHFTNAGELPPKYTMWEWYFWSSRWSVEGFKQGLGRVFGCRCFPWRRATDAAEKDGKKAKRGSQESGQSDQAQRRKGKRRSSCSQSKARAGKIFPSLPRWVAEKQSTDDGRMRLNDPKRSLRGISFGYPFISRLPGSQDSCGTTSQSATAVAATVSSSSSLSRIKQHVVSALAKPNRVLDLLYGVQLKEVRGRPESGRRMFDPWIQRCRYAFCYGLLLLAAGLCTASAYLIAVNTKKLV